METIKIYNEHKLRKINSEYYEVPYTLYRDGVAFAKGTEDFSRERWARGTSKLMFEIREANGRINKGGGVMRDSLGCVYFAVLRGQEKAGRKLFRALLRAEYKGRDIRIV